MNCLEARAILFSSIEGGNSFWTREIAFLGPCEVVDKARSDGYDPIKYAKTITKIKGSSPSRVFEEIEAIHSHFLTPEDGSWPEGLNDLASPPIALIIKGVVTSLNIKSLAIVGTRNPTNYGVRVAGDFAAGFVDREWAIISGGAYGIDAAAHRGALIAEGVTIAVVAAGIDVLYPAGHSRLFEEIAETGAMISEVMPGTHAIPARFLTRNRLIAALSQATLVVEAAFRSGSLRTARDAAELMRPVMAIPGPITSPTSEGCHRLIGERAAEVVTSVVDAVEFVSSFK
ncbi:MAG: DNA-protecting protein DprA [Streptomycetaceae bacterium]|nr:MAG: DNA-protecting protein DprA [Streptomycetaceae bacterium]